MTVAIAPSEESDAHFDALDPEVSRDARDFGAYARTGGWSFALKVARSVRPGGQSADETPKISAKEFAELAGCSPERVMRYYKAWDKAADDGLVPQFEALAPGQDVELPDSDVWHTYYVSRSSAASERGTAIAAAAEAEGIRPDQGPGGRREPHRAARRDPRRPLHRPGGPARAPGPAEGGPGPADRVGPGHRPHRRSEEGGRHRDAGRPTGSAMCARSPRTARSRPRPGRRSTLPAELRAEAERHLSLIDELDEDEDTGEWATDAYDTVKDLVAETVQADPELRVQERRTKFYSSLQKATKVFEELTFDDADDDIYEDDMVQRLEELQQAIGSCIAALRSAAPQQ